MNIIKKLSKNGSSRKQVPNRIVLHAISEYILYEGEELSCVDFIEEIGLSAHAFISPNGNIIQCREDNQSGYHAKGNNKNTLGVEIIVKGTHNYTSFINRIKKPFMTFNQHVELIELLRFWCNKHNISIENIVTHSSLDPTRKYDPGKGFPLKKILNDVEKGLL